MMWDSDRPRLPTWIEDTYEVLAPHLSNQEGGISKADAETFLTTHSDLNLSDADARHALDQLINRGYLYEVEGNLFITEMER
jgi:hypothetical protein